jgi:hypothetical protein
MSSFERALACLAHRTTLATIGLLLLNDHFLKASNPSWWTGKLSDLAGLYFFPFIVAALLGLLTGNRWTVRRTGGTAIAVVGIWFALMKNVSAANEATAVLWSRLVGSPVAIELDPSDLFALVVLVPSWLLWQSNQGRRSVPGLNWVGFLALTIGALASLATSCVDVLPIKRVLYSQGEWFAASHYYATGPDYFHFDLDRGTWGRPFGLSDIPTQALANPVELPVESCLEDGLCYRVEGDERVLFSEDGGISWTIAWQIPPGRRLFMDRLPHTLCSELPDFVPYDVAVAGTSEAHRVVVAMGNQCVLMRYPDGRWERQAVEWAEPRPFAVVDGNELSRVLLPETIVLTAVTVFLGVLLYLLAWRIRPLIAVQLAILVPLVSASLVYVLLGVSEPLQLTSLVSWGGVLLITGFPLGVAFVRWQRRVLEEAEPLWAGVRWWLVAVLAGPAGYFFLVLWAVGVIAHYAVALVAGITVTLGLATLGSVKMRQLMRGQAPGRSP